jgi:amidase
MGLRSLRATISMLGVGVAMLCAREPAVAADPVPERQFHLEEATIADVHRAIRAGQITAVQLVNLYFKRVEAYNGTCVKGEADPETGLMYREIVPVADAGQLNAYMTLNIRGKRSRTNPADNDPKMMDALEVARTQDAYFDGLANLSSHCTASHSPSRIITIPQSGAAG